MVASSPGGNTDRLVGQVLSAAAREGATTAALHLGPDAQLDEYAQRLASADAIVLGTPMYRATYAGALKEFLDRLRRGGPAEGFASALRAKPVGIVATGGSDHHFLGVDPLITLLIRFFAAYVVPPAIYGVGRSSSAPADDATAAALTADAAGLGRALVALAETIRADRRLSDARPQV